MGQKEKPFDGVKFFYIAKIDFGGFSNFNLNFKIHYYAFIVDNKLWIIFLLKKIEKKI